MPRSLLPILALAASLHAKPSVGKPAPDFSLAGLGSKDSVSLSDYRGKVVLVEFWASWCVPCRRLMPKLAELKARLPELRVLALTVDESREKALTFLRSVEPGLKAAHDAGQATADAYALEGMPTCFLVDRKGRLRFRHDGYTAADLETVEREAGLLLSEP